MKKKFMVIALLLTFILTGCSLTEKKVNISNSDKLKLNSKEVVENYFKYYNEKNKTGVLSTLTKWHNTPNMKLGFDSLRSINIIDITNDSTTKQKEAYMKYGRGRINGVKEENVKIYKVTYDIKLKSKNQWSAQLILLSSKIYLSEARGKSSLTVNCQLIKVFKQHSIH